MLNVDCIAEYWVTQMSFIFQCNVLNEKLESLLTTLEEEAQASTQVSLKEALFHQHKLHSEI